MSYHIQLLSLEHLHHHKRWRSQIFPSEDNYFPLTDLTEDKSHSKSAIKYISKEAQGVHPKKVNEMLYNTGKQIRWANIDDNLSNKPKLLKYNWKEATK